MVRRSSLLIVVVAALLAVSAPGLAVETNVYGDPGSSDFSTAMAVTVDDAGAAYVVGVFFGEFQGNTSTEWDIWMARVGANGSFDWLLTWDAPEIDGTDFSQLNWESPEWVSSDSEIIAGPSGVVAARIGSTVVTATPAGGNAEHHVITTGLNEPTMVNDGELGLVGWEYKGTDGFDVDQFGIARERLDGSEVWYTHLGDRGGNQPLVRPDGSIVAGTKLARLGFQTPAVRVLQLSSSGALQWTTDIYDACFQNGKSIISLGDTIGVLLEPPQTAIPSLCDVDREMVASLDQDSGAVVAQRTLKDTLNIIWCDDPRLGIIEEAFGFGFVDGDECGGSDVFWTDVNYTLLEDGSSIEAFALAGMHIVGQGNLGYGILRTTATADRWNLAQFEYLGPATGLMPYDMVLSDEGPIVVGRVFNTAWIDQPAGAWANPSSQAGAATVMTSTFEPSGRFLDDNQSVFESDIEWLASEGITKGCNPKEGNTEFCPTANVTRGQMAAFLVRALGLTDDGGGNLFVDDDGTVFESAIDKLAAAGITKGCNPKEGNTRFCPNQPVTRGQMAAFLVRAMGYTDAGDGDLFIDDDGSIFESAIDKLATAGVTRGCNPKEGNTKFCPNSNVTRGQMAAFLRRALG